MLYDIIIIGGGINGCAIARAAAKNGLKTLLLEKKDLACGTSSASSKLIHGGLRYLEHYAFHLVRDSLKEREIMWQIAPHIIYPMRFILPHDKSLRPQWLIRCGLFLYDRLGGIKSHFPRSKKISLDTPPLADVLQEHYKVAFEYSDCWVDDSRLVVLNAVDAAEAGAHVRTHSPVTKATAKDNIWHVDACKNNRTETFRGKVLINAAGPWVDDIINHALSRNHPNAVQLIKGSHIIVKKLFSHDKAYILQNDDKRIIFALPYEKDFTLIGTTDIKIDSQKLNDITASLEEIDYLCSAINRYFQVQIKPADVVHSYAGVRALHDDTDKSASKLSRDYVIKTDLSQAAPLVHIFGGKVTTARALADKVITLPLFSHLSPHPCMDVLPGGDIWQNDISGGFDKSLHRLKSDCRFLPHDLAYRLLRSYGSRAWMILGKAKKIGDLKQKFGHNLYGVEVDYLMAHEFAISAEDVLWRRSKLGLRFTADEKQTLQNYMENYWEKKHE